MANCNLGLYLYPRDPRIPFITRVFTRNTSSAVSGGNRYRYVARFISRRLRVKVALHVNTSPVSRSKPVAFRPRRSLTPLLILILVNHMFRWIFGGGWPWSKLVYLSSLAAWLSRETLFPPSQIPELTWETRVRTASLQSISGGLQTAKQNYLREAQHHR